MLAFLKKLFWRPLRDNPNIYLLWLFLFVCFFIWIQFFDSTPQPQLILAIEDHSIHDSTMQFQNLSIGYRFYSPSVQQSDQICDGKRVLIVVATAAQNFEARQAIRESWAKKDNIPSDYLVLHIIGSQTSNVTEQELYEENVLYGDLIRYNLTDSYRNLTLKSYAIFDWQQKFCPNVQYVIKIDDDVAADFKRLDYFIHSELNAIAQQHDNNVFFCTSFTNITSPIRFWFSKWYISQHEYKNDYYPKYCSGPFYIMTSKTSKLILESAKQLKHLPFEDAFFTGLAREHQQIAIYDPELFYIGPKEFTSLIDVCVESNSVPRIATKDQPNRLLMREGYEELANMTCT